MIYFIKEIDKDNRPDVHDLCKIGVSKSPSTRIKQLQTGNANELVMLLILMPPDNMTSYQVERILHKRFQREWVSGEWYKLTPRLQKFIAYNLSGNGQYKVYNQEPRQSWGRLLMWVLIGAGLLCAASAAISTYAF